MGYVVLVTNDKLGQGDPTLGKKLMYSYFYSLSEGDSLPSHILLLNNGVKLATEDDPLISIFEKLIDQGVELFACGLCLDFYNLNDQLKVGKIGNMYFNQEILAQADHVITLG